MTVLMPVFNGERYVSEAIESVLAQTYRAFEFVIIDDGSTDRTPEILESYAAVDHRIRVVRHHHRGQPASLNDGLEVASGEWIAILDHDDVALPHRLERQLAFIDRYPDARVVGSYVIEVDANGRQLRCQGGGPTTRARFNELRSRDEIIGLWHPTVMMHRPTILRVGGYDPECGPNADEDLWSRVSDEHLILVLPEPLVRYRLHSKSMSAGQFRTQRRLSRAVAERQRRRRGRDDGVGPRSLVAAGLWTHYIDLREAVRNRYRLARLERASRFNVMLLRVLDLLLRPDAAVRRIRNRAPH